MRLFGNNKEQHILSLFAKGDNRAMDKLYGTYADYLAQVCLRYIGNREDLHDVLQEAFIRIFTGIHSFEGMAHPDRRQRIAPFSPGP